MPPNPTCARPHIGGFPISVGRMQIRHFRRFRQNGLFLAGDKKHGLPKTWFVPARFVFWIARKELFGPGPPRKGEEGRKEVEKTGNGRFPGREGRHTLNPHLWHPHLRQPNWLLTSIVMAAGVLSANFANLFGARMGQTSVFVNGQIWPEVGPKWIAQVCVCVCVCVCVSARPVCSQEPFGNLLNTLRACG